MKLKDQRYNRPLEIYGSSRSSGIKLRAIPLGAEDLELQSVDEQTVKIDGEKISVEQPI